MPISESRIVIPNGMNKTKISIHMIWIFHILKRCQQLQWVCLYLWFVWLLRIIHVTVNCQLLRTSSFVVDQSIYLLNFLVYIYIRVVLTCFLDTTEMDATSSVEYFLYVILLSTFLYVEKCFNYWNFSSWVAFNS